jgi:hypothetical protein
MFSHLDKYGHFLKKMYQMGPLFTHLNQCLFLNIKLVVLQLRRKNNYTYHYTVSENPADFVEIDILCR